MGVDLVVSKKQSFMGLEIPVMVGGFGEGERVLTVPTISLIHEIELKDINRYIKRLIEKERMKELVDFIDIKGDYQSPLSDLGWNGRNIKNAFVLSQRGYSKLIKYMDDDKSWEVHDKLIDEYFQMKEIIQTGSTVATVSDEAIEKITAPIYAMLEQNNKTLDLLVGMMEEQKEKTQRLEARVTQESTIRKFEDLAEKKFKEACETDTRDIRAQFMAEVDVKITHLARALKPAELSKLYNKDSKEFNAWLLKLGLQYKEAGNWKIAPKYKGEGYEKETQGLYGEYLCWNLKGCILIFDLLAAKGIYPTLQEAFER